MIVWNYYLRLYIYFFLFVLCAEKWLKMFLFYLFTYIFFVNKNSCLCLFLDMQLKRLKLNKNNWSSESYRFDKVFTETASQKRVYEAVVKPVVVEVTNSYLLECNVRLNIWLIYLCLLIIGYERNRSDSMVWMQYVDHRLEIFDVLFCRVCWVGIMGQLWLTVKQVPEKLIRLGNWAKMMRRSVVLWSELLRMYLLVRYLVLMLWRSPICRYWNVFICGCQFMWNEEMSIRNHAQC